MDYEVGVCYTFEDDSEQGWSAWVWLGYGWQRVA